MSEREGRSCPIHYRYRPETLCASPEPVSEQVLYVVGGLYGNPYALDAIEAMAAKERQAGREVRLVFNGDFNWFNADDRWFPEINRRVLAYSATLGNVEYELATPSDEAGCGCAYPEFVDDAVVARSNRIMDQLQETAEKHPEIGRSLKDLPRYRCLIFGGLKILVLHGDPESLAGWGLSHENLASGGCDQLRDWFRRTDADVILCTHTCLPVLWRGEVDGRTRLLANNGSAGMGNLVGDTRGLITRVAASPASESPVAALAAGAGLDLALLPVSFDVSLWLAEFDRLWPAGSPAAKSYRQRILDGATLLPEQVIPDSSR
jgi:hypothetical protein